MQDQSELQIFETIFEILYNITILNKEFSG